MAIYTDSVGEQSGRDPRDMSPADLNALGHEAMPVLKAIRAKCMDCCGQQPSEVRRCTASACPLWPFRMGSNPWRTAREMSDEERAAAVERLSRARAERAS